ncbi:MAG: hypothetical protein ACU0DX_17605, partial [Roseovarius sp.]|uniref:hypothetical protein n=1 Tax=Roseovarius sp. TaxID=1486281 RepID=UPI004057CED1
MTDTMQKVQAGLVFLGKKSFDIAAITCGIADALDRLGERVEERRCESDTQATVRARDLVCRVRITEGRPLPRIDTNPAHILELSLGRGTDDEARAQTSSETLIAHLLAGLQATLVPDYVQWTDPRAVLTRAEFRAAVANTAAMPAPVRPAAAATDRRRKRLPDIETAYAQLRAQMPGFGRDRTEEERLDALRAAFRDPDPAEADAMSQPDDIREPTAPLRLSVWMLTFAIGLFALPVAAALTVVNLLRGENMRLTSQTVALTGTFLVLATHGQIAQAANLIATLG